MNTIGGLKVHSDTVHKVPLAQVENAKPERASVDGPEIFLMQGIPIELLNKRRDDIIAAYNEKAAEHFAKTGKALPGSLQEHQHQAPSSKKAKVAVPQETPEQKKARLAEHIAKKRAEKAEREAAAKANGGEAVKQEHGASIKHEDGVAHKHEDGVNIKQESNRNASTQETGTHIKPEPTSTVSTSDPVHFCFTTDTHNSRSPNTPPRLPSLRLLSPNPCSAIRTSKAITMAALSPATHRQ